MRFIIVGVGLDRQLARAGGRDLVLNDVLLSRAREAWEAPGGGRRECKRYEEARRHRAAPTAVVLRSVLTNAAAAYSFPRLLAYSSSWCVVLPRCFAVLL